jgi:hypothetical protein
LRGRSYQETLLHELFHACFHECSLTQGIPHELEEVIVDLLSRVVVENFTIRRRTEPPA